MCSSCRKACETDFPVDDEDENPFQWLYDNDICQTPSSIGISATRNDPEYQPSLSETSPVEDINAKQELRRWLLSTGYDGRFRSTETYQSMSRHDKCGFLRQMKSIFLHILQQLAPNDCNEVWEDLIDEETRKPSQLKNTYYIVADQEIFRHTFEISLVLL